MNEIFGSISQVNVGIYCSVKSKAKSVKREANLRALYALRFSLNNDTQPSCILNLKPYHLI